MPHSGITMKFRPTLTAALTPVTTGVMRVFFDRFTPAFRIMYAPYMTDPSISIGTTGAASHTERGSEWWMYGGTARLITTTAQPIAIDQYVSTSRYTSRVSSSVGIEFANAGHAVWNAAMRSITDSASFAATE